MKKLFKGIALTLAAMMLTASAQLIAFADENLPSAVVTELSGTDLNVVLDDYASFGSTGSGAYTMNKAVNFRTNYPDDAAGQALKESELETYGDWICDFQITFDTPGGAMTGDEIILVGNYGTWGNVSFKVSDLANLYHLSEVPDGTYELMSILAAATERISPNLTYTEIVNIVQSFTCGLIDNNLPLNSTVTVQLVMYEDGTRSVCHEIGDPVIYTKRASQEANAEDIQVGTLDATIVEEPAEGVANLTVEGIKDAIPATEKTKIINDYIVDNNIEDVQGVDKTVNVELFAKTESIPSDTEKFQLTPYARISCDGYDEKEIEITNDQLKDDAQIQVVIPVSAEPLYIVHATDAGVFIDKYTENDAEHPFVYSNGTCALTISHFSTLEAVTAQVEVSDIDAYVDDNGYGNIRFISTYKDNGAVDEYGTWIVPANYLDSEFTQSTAAEYSSSNGEISAYGDTFTADLMAIPASELDTVFYAKSYIITSGQRAWSSVAKSGTVNGYKNRTSR